MTSPTRTDLTRPSVDGYLQHAPLLLALIRLPLLAQRPISSRDVDTMPSRPPTARIAYGADSLQFGELRIPEGPGPFPVAIIIHGGCWLSRFASLKIMSPLADALAQDGIATWNLEYRRNDNPGGGLARLIPRRGERCRLRPRARAEVPARHHRAS